MAEIKKEIKEKDRVVESLADLLEFESELVSTCTCMGSDKC